jgi:hypothetical protein
MIKIKWSKILLECGMRSKIIATQLKFKGNYMLGSLKEAIMTFLDNEKNPNS